MADKKTKFLGDVGEIPTLLRNQHIIVKAGGNINKISLENFMASMNRDQQELLHEVAWGIPLKDELQTSPDWGGLIGNLDAWANYKASCGRYLTKADGTSAKLHRQTSTIYADGTPLDETKGSVTVIAPAVYILVQEDETLGYPVLWVSTFPISAIKLATTADAKFIVAGAYKGSVVNSALVSRSGLDFDTSSKTINGYWSAAQSFGANWGITDYIFQVWYDIMCLCESNAHTNIQDKLGWGVGGSAIEWSKVLASSTLRKTGQTASLGDGTGKIMITGDADANANSSHVSVVGVEDKYNTQWEFCQGVFCGNSGNSGQDGTEVFVYQGNRIPSASELATHPSGEYRTFTRLTSGGYISQLLKGAHFDIFPKAVAGGTGSGYCDNSYAANTGQVVLCGGHANHGAAAGPFCVTSDNAWSDSDSHFGARPAYYGNLTFVEGKDM